MPDDRLFHRRSGHGDRSSLLNDFEFRVWVQYILSADDFGVMRFSAVTLQAQNDSLASRPAAAVMRCLKAVLERGLIRTFVHQTREYAYQPDWQDWQKVKYPRTTLEPCPPSEALDACTPKTRRLFTQYPGGNQKKESETFSEDSENISPTSVSHAGAGARETANANAKRPTLNGERPTLNGAVVDSGELRFDEWLRELQAAYPEQRRSGGWLTQTAFMDALNGQTDGPAAAWLRMRSNLDNQKRGHEWRVKRMVPKLENWLRLGLWEQRHDETAPDLNPKTAGTLGAAAEIMREGE